MTFIPEPLKADFDPTTFVGSVKKNTVVGGQLTTVDRDVLELPFLHQHWKNVRVYTYYEDSTSFGWSTLVPSFSRRVYKRCDNDEPVYPIEQNGILYYDDTNEYNAVSDLYLPYYTPLVILAVLIACMFIINRKNA